MKRPTKIKVINFDFTIEWYHRGIENGASKFGWTDICKQEIYISDDLNPLKTADTLMHELLHALNWVFDIEDDTKEESVARRLSSGLLAIWRDNPELFQYLQWLLFAEQKKEEALGFCSPNLKPGDWVSLTVPLPTKIT